MMEFISKNQKKKNLMGRIELPSRAYQTQVLAIILQAICEDKCEISNIIINNCFNHGNLRKKTF